MNSMIGLKRLVHLALLLVMCTVCWGQKPELVVQTGHSERVTSVAFSVDGKTLASGGWDNTIKLWEVATGRELRSLNGHSQTVSSVAFSVDGKTLASGCGDSTIKLWDLITGQELHTLTGHSGVVDEVAFSADGKVLASGSWDQTIKFWNVATGREIRTLTGHTGKIRCIAFIAGNALASGSEDATVKVWDAATGQELRTFKGHSNWIYSVALSADGRLLASGGADTTIKIWEVATGRELRTLKGHSAAVTSVVFSSDGQTLASGGEDSSIKLWEVRTGQQLRTLQGHSYGVNSVAFSPDGRTLASGSTDHTVKLWDVAAGRELHSLIGHSEAINSVAFSADGKTIACSSGQHTIKLWEVTTGRELRSLIGHSAWIPAVVFSEDGKILASGSADHTVKLWEVATGRELRTLEESDSVRTVAFSADGKTLATGCADNTVKLWEVTTGRQLHKLTGHSWWVESVAFSSDGKTLASADNATVRLWDVATGRELLTLKGRSSPVAFSPDGKTLASGSDDRSIKLWELATGKEWRVFTGHSNFINSMAFSPDSKTLASGSLDRTIKLWDVATGRELRTLTGHSNNVTSVGFSVDGKFLISGSSDTTVKCWRADGSELLASLVALDEKAWLVVTPDGLFDGSPTAWNQILWRFNQNTFEIAPVEIFFNDFYYPGLLNEVFAGTNPRAPADISQKDRRQPQLNLTLMRKGDSSTEVGARSLPVRIDVSQAPAGARDVRLFRNGSLVKVWRGDVLHGQPTVTLETTISIIAGENRLTAYAFNHDNIKSSDTTLTVTGAKSLERKGLAHVLAVGVNQYANLQYSLKYAVADAQDFADEIRRQQAKLGNYGRVEVNSLIDNDATKANILKLLTGLAATAQPEDVVIIYFAGHGTAQGNRFFLVPHDLGYTGSRTQLDSVGLQAILGHSISDDELERAVADIDAGQLLLVIDACNSGQALEATEKRRGPMNSKGLAQLAYEKGMYILTAAQSYQAALEASKLGHGYLTYALVEEGLKTSAADVDPKDSQVLLREWLDYATNRVPQMQQDKIEQSRGLGLEVIFVEGDEKIKDPNKRSLQRPRVFYRRETEISPLVVARP